MNKQYIIEKIKELAQADGSVPGVQKFEKITGLRRTDWYGKYWARWGDALIEAGFDAKGFQQAYPKDQLLGHYLDLVIELQKIPTSGEIRMKSVGSQNFPSHTTFHSVLGNKQEQILALLQYAKDQKTPEKIIQIIYSAIKDSPKISERRSAHKNGYIYLIKFGDFFKIGRSNDFDRRLREIKTKLPEEGELIHVIETDDPEGIEAYWHNRFKDRRARGEWFKISNDDVKVLRKRKFM